MEEITEKLGEKIDSVINLLYSMDLLVPPAIHLTALKCGLPELAKDLIKIHSDLGGENIWEDELKLKE